MRRLRSRERRVLCATAILALGVPIAAAAFVRARTDALADRLTTAGGVPAQIGGIDADLTGAIRLTDVALGELVQVDAIEASVAMGSLLGGQLRADEIRVDGPRVAIRVDQHGDSDLARLARRIAKQGAGRSAARGGPGRDGSHRGSVRRIIVAEGTLTANIAGLGELTADGVELVPDATGVRVITGPVRLRGGVSPVRVDLAFARSAAELVLPEMRFARVLAVAGTGRVDAGTSTIALRDVAVGRLATQGALELRASIDDAGVARALAVDVAPSDLAITVRGDRLPLAALAALAPPGFELSRTRASGSIVVRLRGAGVGATLAVDGSIEQLAIDHPNLASSTVIVDGTLRGELAISADAIAVPHAELGIGAARFTASGWVRRSAPVSGQLDVLLASAPCADLLLAMPPALRGPLDGMTLGGNLGASLRLAIDLAAPAGDGASLASAFTGACTVSAEPPEADVTTLLRAGDQQLADGSRVRIDPDDGQYTSLRRLPYYVQAAFVSAEDGRFWNHPGFDLVQIARSLEIDLRERRLARGGSTISQQLVKNAFLSQRRSLDRKIQEAILTWRLESRLEKTEILERYLNIIELGPRVFGLRAAARYWFGASPRDLTVRQAAFLAALTSQPTSMSRRVRKARGLDPETAERVAIVLGAMKRDGVITSETYDAARHGSMHFASTAVSPEP